MPSNTFIFPPAERFSPTSEVGFARSPCLATFASGTATVSGSGYVSLGDYEEGFVYYSDGQFITEIGGTGSAGSPAPVIFGDWVYYVLNGQLPTSQPTGGIEYVGGAYGGASWSNLAFTGNFGLQIQTNVGGVLGFDSKITTLNYRVKGTELFSVRFQVLDTLPDQIEIQFFAGIFGWIKVYIGIDQFSLGGFNAGPVPPILNNWAQITFTPLQLGMIPGDIITGLAWGVYNASGTSTVVFSNISDLNQTNLAVEGFIDTCQDGGSGFYILSKTGPLFRVPAVGSGPITIPVFNTPSFDYTGITYNNTKGFPYFIGYDGSVYRYFNTVVPVTNPPSGIAKPARQLFNDGTNLYTLFANSSVIGKYNLNTNSWSLISTPFTAEIDTIHYSSTLATLLAGGSNYLSLNNANTITGMTFSVADSQLLTTDSSNHTNVYNTTGEGFIEWTLAQQIAGTGAPIFIAQEPDGNQALVADTANNKIQILTNVGGVWSQTSTVTLTAPTAITTVSSGVTQALVCQPTQNKITVLNKSGLTWATAQTLSITGPTSVAIVEGENGEFSGVVTTTAGVTFIEFNSIVWTIGASIPLTPVPTLAVSDFVNEANNYLYAVGASGGNSEVYVFQDEVLVAQYSIVGTVGVMGVVNFQIVSALSSGSIDVGSVIQGIVSHGLVSATTPANPDLMAWVTPELGYLPLLLISGPNNIWSFYNDQPQSVMRTSGSQTAILSGASWNLFDLKDDNRVASITVDPSGYIFSMLTDNVLYKHSSTGTIASGYPYTIVPPADQEDGVPLGFSKLVWWNGKLWSASSLMGGLTIITP